jgi:Flp pilus assembly protein CpaB
VQKFQVRRQGERLAGGADQGCHQEIVHVDKRKLSIILAVVLALVAVVMVRNYISQTEKKYIKEEKKAYVLVATQAIAAGATIDESMMKMEAIPEKYVQPNAINSPASPPDGARPRPSPPANRS